jgi:hypothetical protein
MPGILDYFTQGLSETKNIISDIKTDTAQVQSVVNLPTSSNPAPVQPNSQSVSPTGMMSYLPYLGIGALALFFFMGKKK